MLTLLTGLAEASTAGAAGVTPVIEFIVSFVFSVAGGLLVLAFIFRGVSFFFAHDRENLGGWIVTVLFGVALVAGARPLAAGVTGFAGGATTALSQSEVSVMEIAGYLLGDVLWWTHVVALGTLVWELRPTRRHPDAHRP